MSYTEQRVRLTFPVVENGLGRHQVNTPPDAQNYSIATRRQNSLEFFFSDYGINSLEVIIHNLITL